MLVAIVIECILGAWNGESVIHNDREMMLQNVSSARHCRSVKSKVRGVKKH